MNTSLSKCMQVANFLENEILSGCLPPGSRIYRSRDLCAKFQSTAPVVNAAYKILEEKKLIQRLPRRGVFVSRDISFSSGGIHLLTDIVPQYRKEYYQSMESAFSESGRTVSVTVVHPHLAWKDELSHLIARKPSLVLVDLEGGFDLASLENALKDTPHLFINRWEWDCPLPSRGIFIDYNGAYEQAVSHFLTKGCRNIFFINYGSQPQPHLDRILHRISDRFHLGYPGGRLNSIGAFDFTIDLEKTRNFIQENPPDALFSPSDEPLFLFLSVLRLLFPEITAHAELVGFHNILYSNIPGHEFSTFAIDYRQFWNSIHELCQKAESDQTVEWLAPELILRQKSIITSTENKR